MYITAHHHQLKENNKNNSSHNIDRGPLHLAFLLQLHCWDVNLVPVLIRLELLLCLIPYQITSTWLHKSPNLMYHYPTHPQLKQELQKESTWYISDAEGTGTQAPSIRWRCHRLATRVSTG